MASEKRQHVPDSYLSGRCQALMMSSVGAMPWPCVWWGKHRKACCQWRKAKYSGFRVLWNSLERTFKMTLGSIIQQMNVEEWKSGAGGTDRMSHNWGNRTEDLFQRHQGWVNVELSIRNVHMNALPYYSWLFISCKIGPTCGHLCDLVHNFS